MKNWWTSKLKLSHVIAIVIVTVLLSVTSPLLMQFSMGLYLSASALLALIPIGLYYKMNKFGVE